MAETFRPPQSVRDEAKQALVWIEAGKAGDGFTDVGRKRASDLATGKPLSFETVLRMYSFLKRHEVDKSAEGFNTGEDGLPSAGRVAWGAWGGDAGLAWATKIRQQIENNARSLLAHPVQSRAETLDVSPVKEIKTMSETRAPLDGQTVYGENAYSMADSVLACDAAIDAAQSLLEQVMLNSPVVAQAYYLLCAADAALDPIIDALGLSDPDEEIAQTEPAPTPMAQEVLDDVPMMSVYSSTPEAEARATLLAAAERLTMTAEVRAIATDDGSLRIGGYAALFNTEASDLPFREVIAPGAFTRSIENNDPVFLLINHDTDQLPLASSQSRTLTLTQDDKGLRIDATLDPSNPRAQELASALTRGDVDKMSFAFSIAPGGETREAGLRTLTDLNLFEVSVVTFPAYDSTSVGMRSSDVLDLELRRRALSLKMKMQNL